jgi:hypothetical protein
MGKRTVMERKKEKKQAILLHYPVPAMTNYGHI